MLLTISLDNFCIICAPPGITAMAIQAIDNNGSFL